MQFINAMCGKDMAHCDGETTHYQAVSFGAKPATIIGISSNIKLSTPHHLPGGQRCAQISMLGEGRSLPRASGAETRPQVSFGLLFDIYKRLEILQWEAQYPESELQDIIHRERQRFILEIFPGLQSLTVTRISKQVGISLRYASLIKKGLSIPHPCLYDKFQILLGSRTYTETIVVQI